MQKIEAAKINKRAFTCPHCGAFAQMDWTNLRKGNAYDLNYFVYMAICQVCKNHSLWQKLAFVENGKPQSIDQMLYPKQSAIPCAQDMPECVKVIYEEASSVLGDSPRAACALLRLALEELIQHLKNNYNEYKSLKGKTIDQDIAELVRLGLPAKVQKALDVVRITGNNAVHSTKELDINDNPDIAYKLFEMLNFIAKEMITHPKEIDTVFEDMPQSAKKAIEDRDK